MNIIDELNDRWETLVKTEHLRKRHLPEPMRSLQIVTPGERRFRVFFIPLTFTWLNARPLLQNASFFREQITTERLGEAWSVQCPYWEDDYGLDAEFIRWVVARLNHQEPEPLRYELQGLLIDPDGMPRASPVCEILGRNSYEVNLLREEWAHKMPAGRAREVEASITHIPHEVLREMLFAREPSKSMSWNVKWHAQNPETLKTWAKAVNTIIE